MDVKSSLANISGQMLHYIRIRAGRKNRAELVRFLRDERDRRGEMRRSEVPMSRNGTIQLESRLEVPSKAVDYWRTYVGADLFDDYLIEARKIYPFSSSLVPPDLRSDLGFGPPRQAKGDGTSDDPPGTTSQEYEDGEATTDQT